MLAGFALAGVLLAGAVVGGDRAWIWWLTRPGPLPAATAVVVPRGTAANVARALQDAGVIADSRVFRVAAELSRGDGALHAAEFAFPAHASLAQVLDVLRTAHPVQHQLTIPEGLTAHQIAALLTQAGAASGPTGKIAEGSMLPQTYDYELGTKRSVLVERAQAAMKRVVEAAWAGRAPGLPLESARQAVILASIVERETAKPEERPHIAAVYLNRLRRGMRLDADPTVAYAVSDGTGVLDRPLSKADLRLDDPYNTYRVAGLPPGPICAPGQDSIEAVLHPAASDDLYFVADGTGGHVFSRDYAEHDAAVARWRALNGGAAGKTN
ncbi:MAG TPA: endolytic transglycosylase MltG [Rhodopila sp.]|uniref:endolytic transglycosylase MltG n=1 Tax=Rhodopila sp. TaxID=2480087 RepID=UPI002BFF3E93|nr:endolytic transglycosylase MltG [Rhodopila sp.]HVY18335.1 endolytic transglycosylase MltG [Rhodopila sp.]